MPDFDAQMKILMHVAIAAVLSGLIGYEREKFDKPAGIRTNMIVGGSVALMVSLGEVIVMHFQSMGLAEFIRTDPNRVIQAIIMGVSFIGAGTVLQIQDESRIKYLTTAATIFFSSGIGIAVALEQYYLAIGVTILILIINFVIAWVGTKIRKK